VDDIHENQLATAGDDDSIIRQIDPYTIRLYNKPGDVGIINLYSYVTLPHSFNGKNVYLFIRYVHIAFPVHGPYDGLLNNSQGWGLPIVVLGCTLNPSVLPPIPLSLLA
jgi:hypothetical protein